MPFSKFTKIPIAIKARQLKRQIKIKTLEGTMIGKKGDWLIIGVKGERYPCDNEIFKETYRPSGQDHCSFCEYQRQEPRPCHAYEVCTFRWRDC